jgi:Uma2 family endonuclease
MATTTRLTAREFLEWEGNEPHVQLIDGEVVVNTPRMSHQTLVGAIYAELRAWTLAEPGRRGKVSLEVDTRLDERNVYKPDVCWRSEPRRPARDTRHLEDPPDLAVEVRSPSTWRYDVGIKRTTYERYGLPELWLVDGVAETVRIARRSHPDAPGYDVEFDLGRGDPLTSPQLPGFAIDLTALFDEP